ncbi:MAG: hypothetical protein HKN09_00200, partial [Saprospiraceae bacterium]|nr:hypothetical protein [Saprospiraceae bacterium]
MKYGLLISGLVEILGGIIVFFASNLVIPDNAAALPLVKMYGLLAFVVGFINFQAFLQYDDNPLARKVFMAMFFFHGAIALMCYRMDHSVIKYPLAATLTHLALFVVLLMAYLK